ncbi:MAG: hypothetical protein Q9163_001508 [Psora crenata]
MDTRKEIAMDDEHMIGSQPVASDGRGAGRVPFVGFDNRREAKAFRKVHQPSRNGNSRGAENDMENAYASELDKSDTEAETVVLTDKEGGSNNKATKAIKLEKVDSASEADQRNAPREEDRKSNEGPIGGSRRSSLKRKRGKEDPKYYQARGRCHPSTPSSTASSPVPQANSVKSSGSRSDRSRSSPPIDDGNKQNGKLSKQRAGHYRKIPYDKRCSNDNPAESVEGHERFERTRATNYEAHSRRTESPPSRPKGRARSSQSGYPQSVTKRKKPAPLNVDRRRKVPDDVHVISDDSSSTHSHHRLRKLSSVDGHAMSPVKISQKKNRDRNGRTLLARACTQAFDEAEKWVRDRPQDIDTPDNAGNTPLQIASLAGRDEVVELLLDAGCDISCKNIDLDTPLIDAVENSHFEVVKLLLRAGVDPQQRNAKGQEPLELVNMDDEDGEDIRTALLQARRDNDANRRQSEDHRQQIARDLDTPPAHTSAASPTESHRSPPPADNGGRRRTARSVPTNDALLWINPTPQRLRDEAGKGNIMIVDHILRMRPEADIQSVLAAVKGGHDDVLGLMIAVASPDPDPEPLRSPGHNPAFSTPMLAAIGRGNLEIIQLLLDQPGFDPTRRPFGDLTYSELAKERQGSGWIEEYSMLQKAYDAFLKDHGRRSNSASPRRFRAKRPALKKDTPEPSSPPQEARKARKSNVPVADYSDTEVKRRPSYQGTAVRPRGGSTEASTVVVEPESGRIGLPKSKSADYRCGSDLLPTRPARTDSLKPKRKLMSGNDIRTDQEARQRAKFLAEHPPELAQEPPKHNSRQSLYTHELPRDKPKEPTSSINRAKRASSAEPARIEQASGKKRLRVSVSPQASRSDLREVVKRKKRQRVGSQGKAINQDRYHPAKAPPAMVANMVLPSPISMTSPGQGAAPVAFMGAPTASPATTTSPMDEHPSALISPGKGLDRALPQSSEMNGIMSQGANEKGRIKGESNVVAEAIQSPVERNKVREAERERQTMIKWEEAERKARMDRQAEVARLEAQRQAKGADRQAQLEREAEEARIAKIKRDEELQRRRMQEEKQRKEEQERRRREQEEQERRRREQEEQERRRREQEERETSLRIRRDKEEQERRRRDKEEQERRRRDQEEQERRRREQEEQERRRRDKEEQERRRREQEEQERRRREQEEQERRRREQEEQERRRREQEEQERRRREQEEQERRRLDKEEQERRRRDQEEQERRRREQEERETSLRIRRQQEEERARIEALPNGLRRAAEIGAERAKDRKEITKWLPLRTVTTEDLRSDCESQVANDRWITNIQAAPILGHQDLELPQCKSVCIRLLLKWTAECSLDTAWTRETATPNHICSLWRQLRNPMSVAVPSAFLSWADAVNLDSETKPKFLSLKVFWLKLSDFMDIVPRHPHLTGIPLPTRPMVLREMVLGKATDLGASPIENSHTNGPVINRNLTNGNG